MNSSDLAEYIGVSSRWIRKQTKEAFEKGRSSIKFGEQSFSFEIIKGSYVYEELLPVEVETVENESSRAWRLASEEKQKEALLKERLVRDYINRPPRETWKKFLARIERRYRAIKPTKSKLFRWLQTVKKCEQKGLVAVEHLLDIRGKTSTNRSYTDKHYEYLEMLLIENPDIEAVQIHRYMEQDFGKDHTPSYVTVVRMVRKWKSDPKNILIYSLASDPSATMSKYRPAPARADSEVMYTNQLWELDGTPADVICSDGIRYTISGAIDVYSRRVVLVVEPTSSSVTLGKMLKKGIQKFGVPEAVLCDQGKEYKSKNFSYTCARLQIEQRFTPPYSGYLKPHIERFFGTLSRGLFRNINGYIGANVSERSRISNRQTFSDKKASIKKWKDRFKNGDEFAKRFAIKKENVGLDIEVPVSKEELEMLIEQFLQWYENRNHRGIDTTPMNRWNSCAVPRKTISDESVLNILIGQSIKKKITKKGITWNKVTYFNDLFYDMVGQSVWVLSDDDLGYIYVYDMEMKYLCKAENYAEMGRSRAEHIAGLKFEAKIAKKQRAIDELRANKPERMKELLDAKTADIKQDESVDIAVEQKSEAIDGVIKAVIDNKNENETKELEQLSSDKGETLVLNGRPMFGSLYERFLWDLENDKVDEDTKRLADKKPRIYAMALEEWESRKAG